jgi:multiple sugar transport system substrate-binding protein/sn-glycerol 3-phosphate transport system substrate-binding protein
VTAFSHGGDLFQDVRASVNIGEPPDLALGYNNQLVAWHSQEEPLVDLNEYVNDPIWGLDEAEQNDFYTAFWDQDVVDGVRLGLPFYRSSQVIFYNQSWARELGFDDPPTSPDEFEEQACASAEEKDDDTGGWILSTETTTILSWIYAFGGQIVEPQGESYRFDTPHVESALTFLRGLLDKGCAWKAETRYPNPEFAARQAIFYTSSIAGLPFQVEAFEEAGENDVWTSIPFPSSSDQPIITVYGLSIAVFKSTPEAQLAAWLFALWLSQPENQAGWVEISSYFPTRASTLDLLSDYIDQNPQFGAALELIPYSQIEPRLASWGTVRWAVSDAAEHIFNLDFDPEQISTVVKDLDATAAEIHAQTE